MLGENKNLKDSQDFIKDTHSSLPPLLNKEREGVRFPEGHVSHIKTNKLITALYMVTDIMDKEEPLRNKLRVLGSEMISDIHIIHHGHSGSHDGHISEKTANKISEILSFLDIASTVGMISEMNFNILKKEFIGLKLSLQENFGQGLSIAELFPTLDEEVIESIPEKENKYLSITKSIPPTRNVDKAEPTRIGVQKGSTLLNALSKISMSDSKAKMSDKNSEGRTSKDTVRHDSAESKIKVVHQTSQNDFDVLKKNRREEILKIVKENKLAHPASGGATISDIRLAAKGVLAACGEKTLQRELVSMVKDTLLNKVGEKRWSKYSV